MINATNIHKSFGDLEVLKGVDLHIAKGEIVSIVGPSGAGKTTLLQILGTLDKPNAGSVFVDGIDFSKLGEKQLAAFRNKHIGFIFQFHQLLPEFTALENVMIPALIAGKDSKKSTQKAKEILAYLQLTDRMEHKPSELSGGEKQRVAIINALLLKRNIFFLDEITSALDKSLKAKVLDYFLLNPAFTVLSISHDNYLPTEAVTRTLKLD